MWQHGSTCEVFQKHMSTFYMLSHLFHMNLTWDHVCSFMLSHFASHVVTCYHINVTLDHVCSHEIHLLFSIWAKEDKYDTLLSHYQGIWVWLLLFHSSNLLILIFLLYVLFWIKREWGKSHSIITVNGMNGDHIHEKPAKLVVHITLVPSHHSRPIWDSIWAQFGIFGEKKIQPTSYSKIAP